MKSNVQLQILTRLAPMTDCMKIKVTTVTMIYLDVSNNPKNVTVDGWTFTWVGGFGASAIYESTTLIKVK